MNDQAPEFDDARYQEEQREFVKREGVAAYFDMIMDSLADKAKIDPAKRELIREGFQAIFDNTRPRAIQIPPMPILPSPYFMEYRTVTTGIHCLEETTIWNWAAILQNATHVTRHHDGGVSIWSGDRLVIAFNSARPAAAAFWEWYTAIVDFNNQPYGRTA